MILHDSPVGPLSADAQDGAITRLIWGAGGNLTDGPLFDQARAELTAYFAGDLQAFTLPLAPRGSAFQQDFYAALCAIPFGETRTYGDLAGDLGGKVIDLKLRHPRGCAFARAHIRPGRFRITPSGGDHANTGDNNAPHHSSHFHLIQ